MPRVRYKHRVTITIDDDTKASLERLRAAAGRKYSRLSGASAVIRRLIREADAKARQQ